MKTIDGITREDVIRKLKKRILWLEQELEIARKEADEPCLRPHVTDMPDKNVWPLPYRPNQPYWNRHPDIMLCAVGGGARII